MNMTQWILITLLASFFVACNLNDEPMAIPSVYNRQAVSLEATIVREDTIDQRPSCVDTFDIIGCSSDYPAPRETIWNCNKTQVARHGDTVFLRSSSYTAPDSNWQITFNCLDEYDPFLIDKNGKGRYIGEKPLPSDPEVEVSNDTLYFKQTVVFLSRGDLANDGNPELVRYPQYGFMSNVDSLQQVLRTFIDANGGRQLVAPDKVTLVWYYEPHFYVAWQKWIYVAGE
jgi:hypothetical protein